MAVVGDRVWQARSGGIAPSRPQPFIKKPISYDVAFGGSDTNDDDASKHAFFMRNPIGRGFHKHLRSDWVDGKPLPNTEEINRPVTRPDGDYVPMSLGPIGRNWEPRLALCGYVRPAVARRRLPVSSAGFRRAVLPGCAAGSAGCFTSGGRTGPVAQSDSGRPPNLHVACVRTCPVHIFPKKRRARGPARAFGHDRYRARCRAFHDDVAYHGPLTQRHV